uniref:Uncharacterized protein n=1 Tax=Attheya septentrionalis TaxID=420275 RepID=A0A7S2UBV5_9STRA|mmetsp:Transcript_19199/g.34817  ORF Transcript_19199/g.34817 Transcript_19199/m.34817 type:complete len:101 (+) Transcript_19199:336-638(+)
MRSQSTRRDGRAFWIFIRVAYASHLIIYAACPHQILDLPPPTAEAQRSTRSRQQDEQEGRENNNTEAISGGEDANVAAVSKHLQVLLHDTSVIFDYDDGS